MASFEPQRAILCPQPHPPPHVSRAGVWHVHEHAHVTSTNLVAAQWPAWHAVRADSQTAGRGRFQRSWISDEGGLWMSAVVPLDAKSPMARILPLAVGVAVCDVLRAADVGELHMRWPNDLLVRGQKLAGLLIDQIVPGLAVVGIGVNVFNKPEELDATLSGHVARLADLVSPTPTIGGLMSAILASVESVWREVEALGPEHLLPRVNALWRPRVFVQLDLDGRELAGEFVGVDASGRLKLRLAGGQTQLFEPHEVRLLREIS